MSSPRRALPALRTKLKLLVIGPLRKIGGFSTSLRFGIVRVIGGAEGNEPPDLRIAN